MVAGTSTGGIIALGLARGLTAARLLQIYIERGGEVFPDYSRFASWVRGKLQYISNRCDTDALYALIDEVVGDRQLWQSNKRLCIPAAETRHFEPFIFKTPHHPDYGKDWSETMAHVAKTTSAAPAHFRPALGDTGYEFIDGGVWANNPVMIAIADALACFDVRREQIKVLSMGCGQVRYEMSWARRNLGGLLSWTSLLFETMQIQSQNVIGQARLTVGGDRVLRIDAAPLKKPIELWDWRRAKDELPKLGEELVASLGDIPRAMFLTEAADPYEAIYTPAHPPGSVGRARTDAA